MYPLRACLLFLQKLGRRTNLSPFSVFLITMVAFNNTRTLIGPFSGSSVMYLAKPSVQRWVIHFLKFIWL